MPFPDPMTNVADFIAAFFGARLVTDAIESDVVIGTAAAQLFPNNPRRVAMYVSNNGANLVALSRVNTVTLTTGRPIAPGETSEMFWWAMLREIEKPMFAIAAAAGTSIHLREVFFV